jgi:hypothetical protein
LLLLVIAAFFHRAVRLSHRKIYTFAARPFCADNVGISILLNGFPAKLGATS